MTFDLLPALAGFALVSSITPGPNNVMVMASGANFGMRRTVPHILGVGCGFVVMLLLVGLGLARLFEMFPVIRLVLTVVSALYLLWLAWKIANAAPVGSNSGRGHPFTFLQAALFQWVNPKAWMMILTGVATFTQPQDFTLSVAIVAGTFLIVGLPLISSWNLFGAVLKNWLHRGRRLRAFNQAARF